MCVRLQVRSVFLERELRNKKQGFVRSKNSLNSSITFQKWDIS